MINQINPHLLKIIHSLPPVAKKGDKVSIDSEFFEQGKGRLHRPHGTFAWLGCSFDGETVYWIDDEKEIQEFFNRLDAGVWIFHHAKYDVTQLRRFAYIPQRKLLWDTMLIEQIMYSGFHTEFSLADLARRYLDVYMSKEIRKEFSDSDTLSREQVEYAAVDVVATWWVYKSQREIIDENDLNIWKQIELPFLWTILSMGGVKLDTQKWIALAEKNEQIAKDIQAKYGGWEDVNVDADIVDIDEETLEIKEVKKVKKKKNLFVGINLNSPAQVKKELQRLGYNLKSTDVEALESIADECKFAREMLDYRKYAKRASTYGKKFVEEYVEADGKIYADIYQIGAECMPAGELVLTNRGYLPVEKVDVGDLVITHMGRVKPVINKTIYSKKVIYKVTLNSGLHLKTTGNHPYLLSNGKWMKAENLQAGDVVTVHSSPELWSHISGWEDYMISSWGRVFNHKRSCYLTPQPKGKWGHLKVTLVRNTAKKRGDDKKDFQIHRLVADAFVFGKSEDNNEVRHLNGIAWDNTVWNLRWGTCLENKQDAVNHGTMCHRYNSSQTKLTDEMVSIIRDEPNYRGRDRVLADAWGISREMVRDVRLRKRWQDIDIPEYKQAEFDEDIVIDVHVSGCEIVYGLEVEDDHSHVTGGIVTHNTGRTSCRAPNLQNQPHEFEYRDCFIADEDKVMIVADWGSQEPRIAAYLSQDEKLMAALNGTEKLYIAIARDVLGKEIKKESEEYKHIKSTVLGIFYGMSAKGLAARIGVSENEAQDMIDAFLEVYPGVEEYMKRQLKAGDHVTSIYGRKIWLNKYSYQWERNALNAPIQSSAADAMKIAAYRFLTDYKEDLNHSGRTCLRLLVHDEIVLEVSGNVAENVQFHLSENMIQVAEEMHEGIKGSAEVFIGQSWAAKH